MTLDLANLRALADAATPGPWHSRGYGFRGPERPVGFCNGFQDDAEDLLAIGPRNAAFIAAAREAIPQLISLVDSLTRERDDLGADIRRMCGTMTKADLEADRNSQALVDSLQRQRDEARAQIDMLQRENERLTTERTGLTHDERCLVHEVCHDLINRAIRHESDMTVECGWYRETDDRHKEAAIRKLLGDTP